MPQSLNQNGEDVNSLDWRTKVINKKLEEISDTLEGKRMRASVLNNISETLRALITLTITVEPQISEETTQIFAKRIADKVVALFEVGLQKNLI